MPVDLSFLATLAKAAYHLRSDEHLTVGGDTANQADASASATFAALSPDLTLLGGGDLAISGLPASSPFSDIVGLAGGLYVNGNAAALVGRKGDTLFISVRGTNDGDSLDIPAIASGGGSFDQDHWFDSPFVSGDEGMAEHYALLKPLFDAAMAFLNNPVNGIVGIDVSGHSLGAAMVQKFMADHAGDARLRAATFGDPGYEDFSSESNDSRILNFAIAGDPVAELPQALGDNFGENGDDFRIVSKNGIPDPHNMDHYLALAGFFTANGFNALFFDGLAANGARDEMNVIVDASVVGDALTVRLPGGNIEGSDAGDILQADATANYIDGRGGADHLSAGAGDDAVVGGAGADRIAGGEGRDFLFGGSFTGEGAFAANSGDDVIAGDVGDDGLWGFDGADALDGGEGSDALVGGAGNDALAGGAGNDFLFGGDFTAAGGFAPNSGNDALNGGDGDDGVWGFDGDDALNGDAGADYAQGGVGDDTINGGAGSDTLLGEDGADTINGGAGFDYLYGGAGADAFIFRKGDSADWILDFDATGGDRLRLLDFGYGNFAAIPLVDLSTPGNPAVQLTFIESGQVDQLTVFGVTLAQLNATNVLVA